MSEVHSRWDSFPGGKAIFGGVYQEKLRREFMKAMSAGKDMAVDNNGDLVLVESRLVYQRLVWNDKTQNFDKVYGNRTKNGEIKYDKEEEQTDKVADEELVG